MTRSRISRWWLLRGRPFALALGEAVGVIALLGAFILPATMCGCAHQLAVPVRVANASRVAGETAARVLATECSEKYPRARSPEEISTLDHRCLPLRDGYRAVRLAHAALVAAIAAAEQSNNPAEALGRAKDVAVASERLALALAAMQEKDR